MRQQPTSNPRKHPKQKRSFATVQAILQATEKVLIEDGYKKASTNRIARVAGVSIGSLYQYFPNKEALVIALIRRHYQEILDLLTKSASSLWDAPLEVAVRSYIQVALRAHAKNAGLERVLITELLHLGMDEIDRLDKNVRSVVEAYLRNKLSQSRQKNLDMTVFVLVSAMEAITHKAVLSHPDYLQDPAFEKEVCSLVLRYLDSGDADVDADADADADADRDTL